LCQNGYYGEDVGLGVQEALKHLLRLPSTIDKVSTASSAHDNSILGILFLLFCEKLCVVNCVREKNTKTLQKLVTILKI
jgi:hypothetical protein